MGRQKQDPLTRLMSHVNVTAEGHWLWTGKHRTGLHLEYGGTRLNGVTMSSHRAMWIVKKGPIPKEFDLLHQCGETLCCNPDHIRLGTKIENQQEAIAARNGAHWSQGTNHHLAKFTEMQISQIRHMHSQGYQQKDIAEELGTSPMQVSRIVRRKTWKHIA